jgi:glycine betaine/proline transport system substrate-binding protein
MKLKVAGIITAIAALAAQGALADDASCKTVHFADVGWSDIAATTGMASVVLEGLGYKPTVTIASIQSPSRA